MKLLIASVLMLSSATALADYQQGYYRKDGTYVQGHMKSEPDQYRYNNYGS
jgi:hypothetical protein